MAIQFPNIDPVMLSIGPINIYWYSIAYILGIMLGFYYMNFLAKKQKLKLTKDFIDDFFIYIILGIIIGGRVGFVMFYDPLYYLNNPIQILQTWKGGMSFHGGLIGFFIATIIASKKHHLNHWKILDITACAAPIGLFLGRIANFINGELFGRITDSKFGVIFPNGGPLPRHPSQLYEALGEGIILFVILNFMFFVTQSYKKPGMLSSALGIFYSIARFTVEIFREPNTNLGYFWQYFTMGQILSLIMLMISIIVYIKAQKLKL